MLGRGTQFVGLTPFIVPLLELVSQATDVPLYLGPNDDWRKEPESFTKSFPTPRHAVEYIMETFSIVKRRDEAANGSYRTRDTILEIHDALTEAIRTGHPYQIRLDPPPGPLADDKGNFPPFPNGNQANASLQAGPVISIHLRYV